MRHPRSIHRTAVVLLLIGAIIGAAPIALFRWLLTDLPPVASIAEREPRPTSLIVDRNGNLLYEVMDSDSGRQIDLSLNEIPQACIEATLATEDGRFYHHSGFDPIAIARAAWQNYRAGGVVVSGGSTLTQQLVRILLLEDSERYEQTYRRKLREAWLAWKLERKYSKDELLALYLNQSYYGNFAFGLEAAAQTFFAKPANQLSRAECALLAGLVQYPSGYNPLVQPEVAKARQLTVLRLMHEADYLTSQEVEIVAGEPLRYRSNLFDIEAPHFVMYVQDLVARRVGAERLRKGGLRIVTTLDLGLQHSAESSVRRRLDLLNCRLPGLCTPQTNRNRRVDNAAAVVLDASTGEILTMVGSPDYFEVEIQGNVNAALTQRQPGSAIKPFTYAAALDPRRSREIGLDPITAATILPDLPATFYVTDDKGGHVPYRPVNYDRQVHGPVSVRTALANSYNIPAVRTLDRIGVETLRNAASASGITSLTGDYGLALTLGGGEVSLLDLVAAYGVFQDGTRLEPVALLDIQERAEDGTWVSLRDGASGHLTRNGRQPVFEPGTAFVITDILSDEVARIPSFGEGSVLDLPFDAAVKTGTTTDWRDNWTVGYSTERIAGVWVGNADNTPMVDVSGVDGAGPIWRDIMLSAHRTLPAPFARPSDVVTKEVCAPSGMLPSNACPRRINEVFIRGTEPEAVDNQFVLVDVDVRTGKPANDGTPAEFRTGKVFWDLPPEYVQWAATNGIATLAQAELRERAQASGQVNEGALNELGDDRSPLHLELPISNTAYQIHPGIPASSQRLLVRGSSGDGAAWSSLRLVVDGTVLADASTSSVAEAWWTLTLGEHRLWIEGERHVEGATVQSDDAYVVVEVYRKQDAEQLAISVLD